MKNLLSRVLAVVMAALLAITCAVAEQPAQAERIRIIAVQSAGTEGAPDELLAALAAVPALAFDYAVFYDDAHFSVLDLTAAEGYTARGAAFENWLADAAKARVRNATHATLWTGLTDMGLALSAADVVWVPATDAAADQFAAIANGANRLTEAGGTLRVYAQPHLTNLNSQLASLAAVETVPVADARFDVVDSLLTEAGYLHRSDEKTADMLRSTEVHPEGMLKGESVLVDWCAGYQLVGSTYTYRGVSVGGADTDSGMAVVAERTASAEGDTADTDIEATFAAIAAQHQLCWYFKPSADLGATVFLTPNVIKYDVEPEVNFGLALNPAVDNDAVKELCRTNLLADDSAYRITATAVDAEGAQQTVTLLPGPQAGQYLFTLPRVPGEYTVSVSVSLTEMPYTYPVVTAAFTMEAPLQVTATQDVPTVQLNAAPLWWHGGETQATVSLSDLFTGSYLPATVHSADGTAVTAVIVGDTLTVTANEAGKTPLYVLSRDGVTGVCVPVVVTDGQQQVIFEGIIALVVLALLVFCILFARARQARFRRGEMLQLSVNGAPIPELPLKSYRSKGVTLERLLIVSGRAAEFKAIKAQTKKIVFLPKLNGVYVKQEKTLAPFITNETKTFVCDTATFTVTLTAREHDA